MDHKTGKQERERDLRAAVIGYLHHVRTPPEDRAVDRQDKAPNQPTGEAAPDAPPLAHSVRRSEAPALPRRPPARAAAPLPTRPVPTEDPEDVTIDLREGERIGGIWQRADEVEEATAHADPPSFPASDRYAFSLAVGNSYCYQCGRFAMHQIVLEARPPTRARRLGAYRCRCTMCEYLSSPRPSEIHRAEEYLAHQKRGAWDRARRAVGVGRSG
jgi:hypothetical protein